MREKLIARVRRTESSGLRQVMSMSDSRGGINLGPGICALPPHSRVLEAAHQALAARHHFYTPSDGVPVLKEALVTRYVKRNGMPVTQENVLVTCGATGALECICKAFLEAGDEVVVFEPFYEYHVRQVMDRGATVRYLRLRPPDWTFSEEELKSAITEKTKLFVFSNPNNPTGRVFSRAELEMLGSVCRDAGVIVVSDEVYEYILNEPCEHVSLASLPGMFEHSLTISSAGKTFLVTGWRIGWLVGPEEIMHSLKHKSDETFLCAPAPLQYAVAECMSFEDDFFQQIPLQFQRKCRQLCDALRDFGFTPQSPEGAYYVLAGYERLGYRSDIEAMNALMETIGVAAIPGSAFFQQRKSTGLLRFCFAVDDDLIDKACQRLRGGKQLACAVPRVEQAKLVT